MIRLKFTENQIEFMKSLGVSVPSFQNLSDADIEQIEDKVSEHLQLKGFNADYSINESGKICESILDIL